MNMNTNKICSIKVVRPSQHQAPAPTSTGTEQVYYDDMYYVPTLYFPSLNIFGWLLKVLIVALILVFATQCFFLAILIFFRIIKARSYTCPKCNKTFKIRGKEAPDRCEGCGADLNPPKCP